MKKTSKHLWQNVYKFLEMSISFHQNHYRNFKHFYLNHVQQFWHSAFPKPPSYNRFIEWIPSTIIPLCVYLKHCFGHCTGISFIDSSKIQVCHNRRISRNKVFQELAARGKTSVDWFFGFKLHLVVNELGEIINMKLTPGNVDGSEVLRDAVRKPVVELVQQLWGKIFGDKGYVSQKLASKLLEDFGIEFFAKRKRNMKNKLMRLHDKLLSRKRSIIENVNDQLKNVSQIEHSRHRSPVNFCANILCGLIAYCHKPKKPSLRLEWLLPQSA
ncbi:IS982 family transposase [Cyanobacterium aponinum UTEX 3222]|nr:IS982 family transposase [Cyanobacterium aponinum UTEX 3222]